MMRKSVLFVLLLMSGVLGATCFGEVDIIVDARPGTLLLTTETGDFEVVGPGALGIREIEEAGELSALPNIKLGAGYSSDTTFADITGQVGVLVNERFRALALGADVSVEYRYRKNVAFGPHLGIVSFQDPEWTGDADINMDDNWGILGGLQVSIGYDVLFIFTIDYLFADPFEITNLNEQNTTVGNWTASDDEINIEGLAVQFGIRGRL